MNDVAAFEVSASVIVIDREFIVPAGSPADSLIFQSSRVAQQIIAAGYSNLVYDPRPSLVTAAREILRATR